MMNKNVRSLVTLIATLLTFTCYSQDSRFDYDSQYSIKRFNQTSRNTCFPGEKPTRQNRCKYYRKYEAELLALNPLSGDGDGGQADYVIPFHLYQTNAPGKNPLVLIVPPLGGMTTVDRDLAVFFAEKGINAIIAINPEDIADVNRPVEDIDGFLIRTTVSMRILLDFAEDQSYIDTNKLGAFGASLGGIRLITLLGVEDRIDASVVYVGSGNIPEVLADSQQTVIKNYREAKIKELGLADDKAYLDLLQQTLTVEPLDNTNYFDPENIFLKISNKDSSVPTKNQWETQKVIGTKHYKETDSNHVRAVIDAMFFKTDIYRFITTRW